MLMLVLLLRTLRLLLQRWLLVLWLVGLLQPHVTGALTVLVSLGNRRLQAHKRARRRILTFSPFVRMDDCRWIPSVVDLPTVLLLLGGRMILLARLW